MIDNICDDMTGKAEGGGQKSEVRGQMNIRKYLTDNFLWLCNEKKRKFSRFFGTESHGQNLSEQKESGGGIFHVFLRGHLKAFLWKFLPEKVRSAILQTVDPLDGLLQQLRAVVQI